MSIKFLECHDIQINNKKRLIIKNRSNAYSVYSMLPLTFEISKEVLSLYFLMTYECFNSLGSRSVIH